MIVVKFMMRLLVPGRKRRGEKERERGRKRGRGREREGEGERENIEREGHEKKEKRDSAFFYFVSQVCVFFAVSLFLQSFPRSSLSLS